MISTLRQNFQSDSANTYYITGAPQCPIPEPNMGIIIGNATFDYLWMQFYNNNNYTYPCALPFNGNAAFNYDQWVNFTATTPSKDAKLFIGVPASPDAANGTPAGATYYITPAQLSQLIGQYGTADRFGGIMMWSAGFSDANVNDGCNYAQEAHAILANGQPCGGGGGSAPPTTSTTTTTPPTGKPTTTTSTTTTTSGGSSPTGAAGAYDQVSTDALSRKLVAVLPVDPANLVRK
jgi:chitinase